LQWTGCESNPQPLGYESDTLLTGPLHPHTCLTTVSSSPTPVSDNCVLEHSLSVGRAAVLETGPLPPQDHKSGTVCCQISDYVGCHIRPVQAVTEDIFIWTVKPLTAQCEVFSTAPNRNILTYLLT